MRRYVEASIWAITVLIAALPWVIFFVEGSIRLVFLYPDHRPVLYALIGLLLAILFVGTAHGLLRGAKMIIVSSVFGFVLAMVRGLWLSQADNDCTSLCFGIFNNILGLGCGSAGEGCATEFFLFVFVVTFLMLISRGPLRYLLGRRSRSVGQPK